MSTIFKVFGMTRPGLEPTTYRCKADVLALGYYTGLQLLEDLKRELQRILDCLNVARCEYIFLGNDQRLSKISEICNINIDKDEFKRANQIKYLGFTIERKCIRNASKR